MEGSVGGPGGIDFALAQLRLNREVATKATAAAKNRRLPVEPAPAIAMLCCEGGSELLL